MRFVSDETGDILPRVDECVLPAFDRIGVEVLALEASVDVVEGFLAFSGVFPDERASSTSSDDCSFPDRCCTSLVLRRFKNIFGCIPLESESSIN